MGKKIIEELRRTIPPVFAGTQIGHYTGGAYEWAHFRNMRKKRNVPDECCVRSGNKLLVVRDVFLDWWLDQLTSEKEGENA